MLTFAENVANRLVRLFHETDLKIGNGVLIPLFSEFDRKRCAAPTLRGSPGL
jgi:hypothetical protein